MIRGTTARFRFDLPCKKGCVEWVTIKFWQPGTSMEPIIKDENWCSGSDDDSVIYVSLDPSETKQFSDKLKAKVQLRGCAEGAVFGSMPESIIVYPMDDNIIEEDQDQEPTVPPPGDDGLIILDGEEI